MEMSGDHQMSFICESAFKMAKLTLLIKEKNVSSFISILKSLLGFVPETKKFFETSNFRF